MKKAYSLRASIAATALVGGCLFAGSALADCTTDNWSSLTNGDALTASGPASGQARYVGRCSLAVDGGATAFVEDTSPDGETSYRARFYVLTNALGDTSGTEIFETNAFTIDVVRDGNDVTFNVGDASSAGRVGWNSVEVHWDESSSNANLLVNSGDVADAVTGAVGSTPITYARLGNLNGVGGSLIFDDFESRRTETIGRLMPGDATGNGQVNSGDITSVVNEFLGLAVAAGVPDCNEDGQVNSGDITCVVNRFLGL